MTTSQDRNISRLARHTFAIVLAGGRGSRLHELTALRSKPAVPFGGKFRIIDFALSNCVNSGIRKIGVATQYKAHSLIRHLVRGWGHFKKELGEFVEILPASQQTSSSWYKGTADAVYQNIDIIRQESPEYVLILSGDQVYKMDYGDMLAKHVASGADVSVACIKVRIQDAAGAFGVVDVDAEQRITGFAEKPIYPKPLIDEPDFCLASMGLYIFNANFLYQQLNTDAGLLNSSNDFGHDVIPNLIGNHRIYAYHFHDPNHSQHPYWRDVGTLDSFWQANMELVEPEPSLDMYDRHWPVWTYQTQMPPAKFVFDDNGRRGEAIDSLVSGGVIISGSVVKKSVVFSDVRIHSYCDIRQAVIFPEVEIGRHVVIRRAIIDSACKIPAGMQIGVDHAEDRARGLRVTDNGVVLVTQQMLEKLNSPVPESSHLS